MEDMHFKAFVHLALVGFVALFPVVNPPGGALIVHPFLNRMDPLKRKDNARMIAIYCLIICIVTILIGSWIFKIFDISTPIVRLAGGILICKTGWDLLTGPDNPEEEDRGQIAVKKDSDDILFFPLAFPITTGGGTISVLLTLSAHENHTGGWSEYLLNTGALFVSVFFICALIYFFNAYTPMLLKHLNGPSRRAINKLSAFLVFCIGIQIALTGLQSLKV